MSDFNFKDPQASVGLQFWKLYNKWQKRVTSALLEYQVTHTQFVILASVAWFREQSVAPSQSEIAKLTGIEKMTLSKAIVRLEKMSLIKRFKNESDTRAISVSLTDKGLNIIPILIKVVERIDSEILTSQKRGCEKAFVHMISDLNNS